MAEKKPTKRTKRMTPAEWAEAKALWESGEFTLSQISEKVGATREHLSRKFKEEKVEKGSKSSSVAEEAEEAVKDEISKNAKLLPMRAAETKEQHYKTAENINKMTMMIAQKSMKDTGSLAGLQDQMKVLNMMSQITGRSMDQRYKALGMDQEGFTDQNDLPELPITLLTEPEMDAIRGRARAQSIGVDDGLGGVLPDEIVEEGFEDDDEA